MDKEFWAVKFDNADGADVAEISMTGAASSPMSLSASAEQPKLIMPVVGDRMRFLVLPFGQVQFISEHMHTQDGQNVIEVEVTATKKVHVSYE